MKQAIVFFAGSLLASVTFAQDLSATYAKLKDAKPEVVIAALGCDDASTRELALAQIARENLSPELTRAAVEAVSAVKQPGVKAQLIAVLAERGDASAAPAIRKALKDTDPMVRAAAAEACGLLKDAKAADALFELLAGEQADSAREALRRIPDKAIDARLVKQLRKGAAAERAAALDLLSARRYAGVFRLSLDKALFTAGDAALAKSAAAAIRTYAPADSFGELLAFSLTLPASSADLLAGTLASTLDAAADKPACERRAAEALTTCGAEHAPLLTALLASGQGAEALHTLAGRLESADLEVRKDAVRNLGKWNSEAALVPLVMAAKRERDAAAQTLAWRAVIDIAKRSEKIADFHQPVSALQQAVWCAPRQEDKLAALNALPPYHVKDPDVLLLLEKVVAERPELAAEAQRIKAALAPPVSGLPGR